MCIISRLRVVTHDCTMQIGVTFIIGHHKNDLILLACPTKVAHANKVRSFFISVTKVACRAMANSSNCLLDSKQLLLFVIARQSSMLTKHHMRWNHIGTCDVQFTFHLSWCDALKVAAVTSCFTTGKSARCLLATGSQRHLHDNVIRLARIKRLCVSLCQLKHKIFAMFFTWDQRSHVSSRCENNSLIYVLSISMLWVISCIAILIVTCSIWKV